MNIEEAIKCARRGNTITNGVYKISVLGHIIVLSVLNENDLISKRGDLTAAQHLRKQTKYTVPEDGWQIGR
jgi:hypothetical protein